MPIDPTKTLDLVACPKPFETAQVVRKVNAGGTITEILCAEGMGGVVTGHWLEAVVEINGQPVAAEYWSRVRPKDGQLMTVKVLPAGDDGKDIARIVLLIGVMAMAMWVPGAIGLTGFWAGAMAGAIGIGGSLAINALIPPPTEDPNKGSQATFSRANAITGTRNVANPYGVVPQVFGKHLIYPYYAAEPYTEYIGDDQYIRLLFIIGYGFYDISAHKIGSTAVAEYDELEMVVYDDDNPLTAGNGLFPAVVSTETFSVELTQAGGAETRTTEENCDEFSVDITWPMGLYYITNKGEPRSLNNSFTISYSIHNANSWTNLTSTSTNFKRTNAFTKTWGAKVARDQYDIRVTRLTEDGDSESNKHIDSTYWTTLRTIQHKTEVDFPGCTYVAMRVKATGQLNGIIDQYNCIPHRKLSAYNTGTGTWGTRATTRNAALAYCEILKGAANRFPVADARLDLTKLMAWGARMDTAGWYVDAVIDYETTPYELLKKICAAGRASFSMQDMKFTVVEDLEQTTPRQHITPRNSWGFSAVKNFVKIPHALKCRFRSEDMEGYAEDELIVYNDGYTAENATDFENLPVEFITDPDLVWKIGRYHLAAITLRPWVYTVNMDAEHLVATRGDLTRCQYDTIGVGLGSGRIKSVTMNQSNQATAIVVDNAVPMESGKSYVVVVRRSTTAEITATVNTVVGDNNTTLTFTSAQSTLPVKGDLFSFGEADRVFIDLISTKIRPSADMTAEITLVDAAPDIQDADTGEIPDYDPGGTLPPSANRVGPPKPDINSVITQYSTNESQGPLGQLLAMVYFGVPQPALAQPAVYYFQAEYMETDGAWKRIANIPLDQRVAYYPVDLDTEYDFRIRSVSAQGYTSAWDTWADYTTSVTSWVGVNVTGLQVKGGGTTFSGRDCHIEWDATEHVRAAGYKVMVSNTATSAELRSFYLPGKNSTEYCYTYAFNLEDTGGGPVRALTFNVWVYDSFGTLSSSDPAQLAELDASNPAPTMAGLTPTVTGMTRGLMIDWRSITPADNDLIGFSVFCSTTQADVTNLAEGAVVATVDQYTRQWFAVGLEPEDTYYVRILPWDGFGSGVASSATSAEPLRLASEDVMVELVGSITITDSFGNEYNSAD